MEVRPEVRTEVRTEARRNIQRLLSRICALSGQPAEAAVLRDRAESKLPMYVANDNPHSQAGGSSGFFELLGFNDAR